MKKSYVTLITIFLLFLGGCSSNLQNDLTNSESKWSIYSHETDDIFNDHTETSEITFNEDGTGDIDGDDILYEIKDSNIIFLDEDGEIYLTLKPSIDEKDTFEADLGDEIFKLFKN